MAALVAAIHAFLPRCRDRPRSQRRGWPARGPAMTVCSRLILIREAAEPRRDRGNPLFRNPRRIRQDRRGDCVMDATLIVIENDAELARAQDLIARLMISRDPVDLARLQAQACL